MYKWPCGHEGIVCVGGGEIIEAVPLKTNEVTYSASPQERAVWPVFTGKTNGRFFVSDGPQDS